MKNFKLKAMLLVAVLLCSGTAAFADTEIWQDSIKYTLSDYTAYVSDANLSITTANIPEKITCDRKDYTVTSIGDYAFDGCHSLSSVDIPSSVTSIENYAFYGCSSLASVVIPNSVASIGESAFDGCSSLASVVIPSSVTSIGGWAFCNCSSLASVVIPNSVMSIGKRAFKFCGNLASVIISSSVMSIEEGTFHGCTSLASVDIPSSVKSIGESVFEDCGSLDSAVIPSSVTSLGKNAFYGCFSLKKLVCNATTPPACRQWGVFEGIDKNECTLIVPQESLDAYKSAAQWKSFFNITTGIKNVPNTSSSATESERYSTDGTRIASPQKGINIIRMSDGTVKKVLVK